MATRTIARLYDTHDDAVQVVRDLEAAGIAHDRVSIVAGNHDNRHVSGGAVAGSTAGVGAPGFVPPGLGPAGAGTMGVGGTAVAGAPGVGMPGVGSGAAGTGLADRDMDDERAPQTGSGAGAGASIGTIIGGGAGLLAGIGAIAIPGVGPVIAAGWLVALLTGAGIGAAAGGLLGSLTGAGVSENEAHVYSEGVRRGGSLVTVRTDDSEAPRIEQIMAAHGPVDWKGREADYRAGGWDKFDPAAPAYTGDEVARERDRVRSRL